MTAEQTTDNQLDIIDYVIAGVVMSLPLSLWFLSLLRGSL
jgi:hypothetical protein